MSRVTIIDRGGLTAQTRAVCDALIDQGRTIDGDPVGYGCTADATHHVAFTLEDGHGGATEEIADLCPRCHALWREEPGRVTLRPARGRVLNLKMKGGAECLAQEHMVTIAPLPPPPVTLEQRQAECRQAAQTAAVCAVRACAAWLRKADLNPGCWRVEDVEGWHRVAQQAGDHLEQAMLAAVRGAYEDQR